MSRKTQSVKVSAENFRSWMDKTKMRYAADVRRSLGLGANQSQMIMSQITNGEDIELKMTTALAMSAVVAGLGPYGQNQE